MKKITGVGAISRYRFCALIWRNFDGTGEVYDNTAIIAMAPAIFCTSPAKLMVLPVFTLFTGHFTAGPPVLRISLAQLDGTGEVYDNTGDCTGVGLYFSSIGSSAAGYSFRNSSTLILLVKTFHIFPVI